MSGLIDNSYNLKSDSPNNNENRFLLLLIDKIQSDQTNQNADYLIP